MQFFEPQRGDHSAPTGRNNEAQANSLGLDTIRMYFLEPQWGDHLAPTGRNNEAQANGP
jgi:hypothetical protein